MSRAAVSFVWLIGDDAGPLPLICPGESRRRPPRGHAAARPRPRGRQRDRTGLRGVRLHEFDIGLGEISQAGGIRRLYVSREQCRPFFAGQKHKDMVLVVYNVVGLENEELQSEVDKTVDYFKAAGYRRIVLIQRFNQGIVVLHDSTNPQSAGKYVAYEGLPAP